jgi:hypothetical protein
MSTFVRLIEVALGRIRIRTASSGRRVVDHAVQHRQGASDGAHARLDRLQYVQHREFFRVICISVYHEF